MDFKLTSDGDLILGQQSVDEEGYLLYYKKELPPNSLPDVTRDIDEGSVPIRDIETVFQDEERLQLIQSRLRTDNPDWYLYEDVGASLSDFIGLPNNPDTANQIEIRVKDTLLRNEAFLEDEISVNVIPVSQSEIVIDVVLDSQNRYLRYAITLDFNVGINNTYVLDREGMIVDP